MSDDISPEVLEDGRWVNDHGIQRWVPWVPPTLDEVGLPPVGSRRLQSAPDRLFDLTRLVALLAAAPSVPPDKRSRPRMPFMLSDEERRAAHSAYVQGDRSPEVRFGEREYKRANQRSARAARGAMYGETA